MNFLTTTTKSHVILPFLLVGFTLFSTSCAKETVADNSESANYQEHPIKSLEDVGIYKCDFTYNSDDQLTSLSYANGETHNCISTSLNIQKINIPVTREISCEYDANGNLTGYQDLEGELRQWYQISYDDQDRVSSISVLQGTLDDNKHWNNQIIYTIEDIVYVDNAIKTARYVIYLSNSPSTSFNLDFETSGHNNPLYLNVAYIVSPNFVDFMFNLSKFSPKNITKVTVTEVGNNSNSYDVDLAYQLNSDGLPSKISIDHPFNKRDRLIEWE